MAEREESSSQIDGGSNRRVVIELDAVTGVKLRPLGPGWGSIFARGMRCGSGEDEVRRGGSREPLARLQVFSAVFRVVRPRRR